MDRFQHIIRPSYYGHVHEEEIQVVRSIGDNKNINFNFYAGSVTPHKSHNPCFDVITLDKEYMIPINIQSYTFDLKAANAAGSVTWELQREYLSYYGIADLRPDNLFSIAEDVLNSETAAIQYDYDRMRRYGEKKAECDLACRTEMYCFMTTSETLQWKLCQGRLLNDYIASPLNRIENVIIDEWYEKKFW